MGLFSKRDKPPKFASTMTTPVNNGDYGDPPEQLPVRDGSAHTSAGAAPTTGSFQPRNPHERQQVDLVTPGNGNTGGPYGKRPKRNDITGDGGAQVV